MYITFPPVGNVLKTLYHKILFLYIRPKINYYVMILYSIFCNVENKNIFSNLVYYNYLVLNKKLRSVPASISFGSWPLKMISYISEKILS